MSDQPAGQQPAAQQATVQQATGHEQQDMTGAKSLWATLAAHGIDTVFGQSIPSQLLLATPSHGITQITYRTENAGAVMADGYARASGRIGVVTAQNGPAATLLVARVARSFDEAVSMSRAMIVHPAHPSR